jgi:general secretion pathway protein A
MYEAFFQLEKSPFGMNPDPSCLFMTRCHKEAFAGLLYAISRRKGFVVLTGDAGTGKTSLLRALIQSAGDSSRFSVILTPRVNSDEFLELALLDFGLTEVPATKSQRIVKLQELLMDLRHRGIAPVLMVDEAHTLSPETLEEIRLLTNFETTEQKLLQIVLAGQNDLAAILNRGDLRQLKQRIEVRMDLKPLEPNEVGAYMEHRWKCAGGMVPLPFAQPAIALIARAAKGIPRLVNSICDNCLLLAYAGEEPRIGVGHVQQVIRDFDLGVVEPSRRAAPMIGPPVSVHPETPRSISRRSSIAPRSFLDIEDDVLTSAAAPSPPMRWAERMNLGVARKRET